MELGFISLKRGTRTFISGWHPNHCGVVLNETQISDMHVSQSNVGPAGLRSKGLWLFFLLRTDCDTPCCETAQPLNPGVIGVVFVGEESTGERWCCP